MQDKIVDLTHVLSESMTVYPDTEAPKVEVINTVDVHGFAELKLTNVDRLPESGFTFQCFPLYIEHADGSPVRAVAMIG
jgi:kynurenine formamidase